MISQSRDPLLSLPSRKEGITIDIKPPRVLFAAGTLKGVNRRADDHIHEPGLFKHFLPGCTRQTASNSTRPEIDVLNRDVGHGMAVRDVRELQTAAGPKHAVDLLEHHALVRA